MCKIDWNRNVMLQTSTVTLLDYLTSKPNDVLNVLCDKYRCSKGGKKREKAQRLIQNGITRSDADDLIRQLDRLSVSTSVSTSTPAQVPVPAPAPTRSIAQISRHITEQAQRLDAIASILSAHERESKISKTIGDYFKEYPAAESCFQAIMSTASNLHQAYSRTVSWFVSTISTSAILGVIKEDVVPQYFTSYGSLTFTVRVAAIRYLVSALPPYAPVKDNVYAVLDLMDVKGW